MNDEKRKAIFARKKRLAELDKMKGYNQDNDDYFIQFPKCQECNPNGRVIMIPNTNPIVKAKTIFMDDEDGK